MGRWYRSGKANVIIDGQWGSSGKGKLAGFLALRDEVDAVICDFMPNAGHTWVSNGGTKHVFRQLPTTCINKDCEVLIGPTAGIDVGLLMKELEENPGVAERLAIHPLTMLIEQKHRDTEATATKKIASTMKGCGAALCEKIMRDPATRTAKDEPRLKRFISDTQEIARLTCRSGKTLVIETAQGFDLSLNCGWKYPYCTSRDVTTAAALNGAGVPPHYLGEVIGCLRTYPIRVGNVVNEAGVEEGNSGPYYKSFAQEELTWDEVTARAGNVDRKLLERTTVTQRIRRVFTFSGTQLYRFIDFCEPTMLFINFMNYVNHKDEHKTQYDDLTKESKAFVQMVNAFIGQRGEFMPAGSPNASVRLLGTGANDSDMIAM